MFEVYGQWTNYYRLNEITNSFNKYLIDIGPNLANNTPHDNKPSTTCMGNRVFESVVKISLILMQALLVLVQY